MTNNPGGIKMEIGYGGQTNMVADVPQGIGRNMMPTIEDRLLRRKSQLEADLNDVNTALEALQGNPEVLKILCLISKVNY